MEALLKLAAMVKCSVHLTFNHHKDFYETGDQYYNGYLRGMKTDTVGEVDYEKDIWDLQIYDKTPIGFYKAISNDLDALVAWGIETVEAASRE